VCFGFYLSGSGIHQTDQSGRHPVLFRSGPAGYHLRDAPGTDSDGWCGHTYCAHIQVGPGKRHLGAHRYLCRRYIWREPDSYSAEHPRHSRERSDLSGWVPSLQDGQGFRGVGLGDHCLFHRVHDRTYRPFVPYSGAGQRGAEVQILRGLLAGGVRCSHLRQPDGGKRSYQGLDFGYHRHPALLCGDGGHPRVPAFHFRGVGPHGRLQHHPGAGWDLCAG